MKRNIVRQIRVRKCRGERLVPLGSLLVFIILAAAMPGCSDGIRDQNRADGSAEEDVSLLFSVLAPTLTIAVDGDGYRLAMPATSAVSWFTDRPDRTAGTLSAADLAGLWSAEDFLDDPPNAALVVTVSGEQQQSVVELTDASVEGVSVSFHATEISGDGDGSVGGRSATHDVAVGTFGASELFIDNASTPPCASSITAYSSSKCLLAPNQIVSFSMKPPYADGCIDTLQSAPGQTTQVAYLIPPSYQAVPGWISNSQPTYCMEYPSGASWRVQNGANPSLFGYDYPSKTSGGDPNIR